MDYILNEFIKNCPKELITVIVKLFNIILDTGIVTDITIIAPLKNVQVINCGIE